MAGKAQVGLIGLGVMGENLVLNMERNGYTVAIFNRSTDKVDAFVSGPGKGKKVIGCKDLKTFADTLETPRKIILLVKAGDPVLSLDDSLMTAQRAVASAQLDSAKATLNTTQSAYDTAQQQYETTLSNALASEKATRTTVWKDTKPTEFDQPNWFFSKEERIKSSRTYHVLVQVARFEYLKFHFNSDFTPHTLEHLGAFAKLRHV